MTLLIENRAKLPENEFRRIAGMIEQHQSIKSAIDWMANHDPKLAPGGMVTQDEFSHDILVTYPGGLWLVYDST
jgi:hypothetical protein